MRHQPMNTDLGIMLQARDHRGELGHRDAKPGHAGVHLQMHVDGTSRPPRTHHARELRDLIDPACTTGTSPRGDHLVVRTLP